MNTSNPAMSIHIDPDLQVLRRLERQRRLSALSSVVIAALAVVLLGMVLALVLIPGMARNLPDIVAYVSPERPDPPTPSRPKPSLSPKPSPPIWQAPARALAARTTEPLAIEVPEVSSDLSLAGVYSEDFGRGWDGNGSAGGNGGHFGSTDRASGGLEGWMYDFKQQPDGDPVEYDLTDRSEFVERALRLQRSRFSEASLARHFRAPQSLYLTHLAIPFSPAAEGPSFFGAGESIKPSGWIARYRGTVTVPRTGIWRFSGLGDDYLLVMVDGRMRLAACWPDIQGDVAGRWDATEPTGQFKSPFHGARLVYGDWLRLEAGQRIDIDIVIGERPGGYVGFLLHIEEKGTSYRKAADGRPILPLFTTAPLPDEEKARLNPTFAGYEIEWEDVPVFKAR